MKILMIHPHDIFSPQEPWTIRITNIARELSGLGHQIKLVFFPLQPHGGCRPSVWTGVETVPFDRRVGPHRLLYNIYRCIRLAAWADVIHFQKSHYYSSVPAIVASFVTGKPLHYDWDDWETKIFYYSNPTQRLVGEFMHVFERFLPIIADTVSVASKALYRLCRRWGVREDNIFPSSVGADIEQFKPLPQAGIRLKKKYDIHAPLVMYVGQLHGAQYAELFIRAAKEVLSCLTEVVFMVVGTGYREEALRRLVGTLNLEDRFIFTGSIAHEYIPEYLAAADVCVACFEDNEITRCKSPLKIVEYLACGKPIVASDVGEVGRMVGDAGILAKPGDVNSLAQGIVTLLCNESLRRDYGERARRRACAEFTWGETARNLLDAYKRATLLNS